MNKTIIATITASVLLSAPFALACDYPARPKTLPNGTTATKEEMLAGVKLIAEYQKNMETYLDCIDADETVAIQALDDDENEDGKQQRKTMFDKKYNAAVEEQTRIVEQFNAEIRAYKTKGD